MQVCRLTLYASAQTVLVAVLGTPFLFGLTTQSASGRRLVRVQAIARVRVQDRVGMRLSV